MPENPRLLGRGRFLRAIPLLCALIVLLPLPAGCSSPPAAPPAQASTATAVPATVLPAVTAPPAGLTPTAPSSAITSTLTAAPATPAGTPTPRPTPSGPAPADPKDVLNVFDVVTPGNLVAKRDFLPLDGGKVDNVLVTITAARLGADQPLTDEATSAIGIMTYDPTYYEWNLTWQSVPISGTARPLPGADQIGGTNGADLLRTGSPILELRTTTLDGAAHLELFSYDRKTHSAAPLKMVPQLGAAETDAIFAGDLDVNVADLNDDGVHEVVADNVAGVNTWRWDGSKFVPRVAR